MIDTLSQERLEQIQNAVTQLCETFKSIFNQMCKMIQKTYQLIELVFKQINQFYNNFLDCYANSVNPKWVRYLHSKKWRTRKKVSKNCYKAHEKSVP